MKRQFSVLACLVLVVAMIFTLASCDLIEKIKNKGNKPAEEHTHSYVEGKCECGESDPNYVAPHTHNFVEGKCECGEEDPNYVPEVPECTEHAYSVEVTKEANCTEPGERKFTCTLCGDSYTSEVAPLGHDEVKVPGTAPTCTEKGLSDGKECSVCGEVLAAQIELNAAGHNFVEGTCDKCGEVDPEYNGPKTYVFDVQTLTAFAAGAKADGDTESVGDFFTIYYSAKTKVDTTKNKVWSDGYTVAEGLRLNWGGTTSIGEVTKNAIEINVDGTATVKVWWVCGGDGREIGIFDANGELVAASKTDDVFVESEGVGAGKNGVYLSELALDAAGKYFIGTDNTNATKNGGNIIFKVEVVVTPAEEVPAQEIKVETTDTYTMYNLDFFTFTATAEGYYTFKIPAGLGVLKDGANAPEIDYYDNANGSEFTIGLKADQEVKFWVSSTTKDLWTIEWSFEEGEVKEDEPDTPIEGDATELVVGSNNVVFGEGELSQGKSYPFVVTEEGTYTFRSDLVAVVMDAEGNTLGRGQVYLTPGSYSVTLFSMMPMPANSFVVNITFEAPATGEPDGSEENPFVWETLPESVTFESDNMNMVYYVFTATADGSVTLTWAVEGNDWFNYFELVDGMTTANNASGYAQTSHTFVIETGKTYRVGLGTWNEGGETVVTIAFVACAHEWSEATCQTLSTCAKCGATTGDYADHIPNSENPTCGDPAECTVCGTEVGYIPHSWDEGVVTQQPDCSTETNGSMLLTCTVCGATQVEDIWVSHDWVVDEEIPVTCTEDGYYKAHCSVCNKIDEYTTEAQGHYNWYATCGDTTTCMECGIEFTVEHSGSPATCTEPMYCYNCWQYIGEALGHNYVNGICSVCEAVDPDYVACEHSYFYACDKVCQLCGEITNPNATHTIVHVDAVAATCYENGNIEYWYCEICGYAWADEALTQQTNQMNVVVPMAHAPATHVAAKDPTCTEKGNIEHWLCEACGQAWLDEACTQNTNVLAVVLPTIDHDYVYGICSVCQAKDPAYVDYYLVGYINNADYGCEADYANLGEYKFVDGKLTVTFNADSYVFVKTGNLNGESVKWYLFESYHGADKTEGTLIENKSEKMFIPGGVEVIFTLVVNEDGTLTLSYHIHSYEAVVTEPTCTAAGYTTHTCSCGDSYTDSDVAALGHDYVEGICSVCDAVDPNHYFVVSISDALAAADGKKVQVSGTVSVAGAWNSSYGNMNVTIVDADGNELYIYRLATEVALGDIITVKGVMATYNDARQIAQGGTATIEGHDSSYDVIPEFTIPDAIKADDGTNVVVTGTVVKINGAWNSSYGNMNVTIADENGNELYVYRLATNVALNDIIKITGSMGTYGGARQIAEGSTAEIVGTHTCSNYSAATCLSGPKCVVCGTVNGDAIDHNYVDGVCSGCGAAEGVETVSESLDIAASTGTYDSTAKTITWASTGFTFVNAQASSTSSIRTSDTDHFRAYAKSETTISGSKITKVVITCTSSSYATACAGSVTTAGVTATVDGNNVVITVDNGGTLDAIVIVATAQWRLNNVEVTYQK